MSNCSSCLTTLKKSYACGLCQGALCKDCSQFMEDDFFSFLKEIPEELKHTCYCMGCYNQKIKSQVDSYLEIMERARNLYVMEKNERNVPLIRKAHRQESVENLKDRQEVIFRLAFFAAQQGYNALIEVDVVGKKTRTNGYQKTSWSGTGFPAQIRAEKLRENRFSGS